MTALVCEDDPAIRLLVQTLLQRQGLSVIPCANGDEGIAQIVSNEFKVIVLDLMMPKSSGFDLLEWLQANQVQLLSRVIVLTAAVAAARKSLPYEVAAVMTKPFDLEEFSRVVGRVVTGHDGNASS
jgi:DNA-binding response OmpR family regulator